MKKILGFLIVMTLTSTVAIGANKTNDDVFMEKLMTCTPYSYTSKSTMFEMEVNSLLQIVGSRGGRCGMNSIVNTPSGKVVVKCNFTKEQINSIVPLMVENSSEISGYTKQNIEANPQMMENPAVVLFNKYLSDPNTCNVTNE